MNRGEIRDKARKSLGETTASFWTDAELNKWIDEVHADLAWRTKSLRKNAYMTPTVSTMEYTLSTYFSDWLDAINVYFKAEGTTWKKLTHRSKTQLEEQDTGWLSASDSTPKHYSVDLEEDWLLIWPPPNAANTGTNYLRAWYIYTPGALGSDSAIPAISSRLHETMVEGVKAVGFETRGLGDRANNSRTLYLKQIRDYLIERDKHEDEEVHMTNYR